MDYSYNTIAELATLIEGGEVSPLQLTQGMLARIDALNPDANAYLHIAREHALAAAARAEQEIQAGQYRGPLHGIPLAVKDLLSVAGQPRTCGSKVLSGHADENDARLMTDDRTAQHSTAQHSTAQQGRKGSEGASATR